MRPSHYNPESRRKFPGAKVRHLRLVSAEPCFRAGQCFANHLTFNIYPPLPDVFLAVAERAIQLANAGNPHAHITIPAGDTIRASQCIEILRLHAFLDDVNA
jgi:hypothetical protein